MHGFEGPGVGVVDDAGVLVGFDALAFDDSSNQAFLARNVIIDYRDRRFF